MNPFTYTRAANLQQPTQASAANASAKFLAGGTNLIDLMKMGVERLTQLVDVNRLPLAQIEELPNGGGVRIGALARNSDVAEHALIVQRYPVLSQALLAGASPQLRNLATTGGNLLQRTRCYYFYDPAFPQCNKRQPGSGCGALNGFNRIHAILGQSEQCIATNPSDMNVALAALDAVVQVQGAKGTRSIAFADFHRLPGDTPNVDTNLQADELITAVDLPVISFATHSHYLKVRDRAKYAVEFEVPNCAYGWTVESNIAKGKILSIDTKAAQAVQGVLAVVTHLNAPKPKEPAAKKDRGQTHGIRSEERVPFSDAEIHY